MQFISLNTNSYAFGYKTKPGFGWSTGLAVRLVFPLQGAADLLHELGHVSHSPGLQQSLSITVLSPAMPKCHHVLADQS